jgi:periplasmic mercuric ion binding protein
MIRVVFPTLAVAILSVLSVAPTFGAERTVTLAVDNMTCALCPPIVRKSLARVPGVEKADVSAEKSTATVVFDDQMTNVAALVAATTNAGYPSRVAGR